MTLTPNQKDRISDIRRALRKLKQRGFDVSTWEATFFLQIIDQNIRRDR